jgi:hypothetical protein
MRGHNDYPNTALLFVNDRKRSGDTRDYQGSGELTCPHCGEAFGVWLSGWRKQGKHGPFLSLSFKAKDTAPARKPQPAASPEPDDIPF